MTIQNQTSKTTLDEYVSSAIEQSKSQNEIVHMYPLDVGISVENVRRDLLAECEGNVETTGSDDDEIEEFWGQDCDGVTWRVHVHF